MPTRHPGARVSSKPVCHWTSGPGAYTRDGEEKESGGENKMPGERTSPATSEGHARYVVHDYARDVKRPHYMRDLDPRYTRPMAYVDQTVVPDAEFGCDTFWLLPGNASKTGQLLMDEHVSPHGTSIVLNAMNYADITDLCAEAELWIGGEKHLINKSFGAYIPPGVKQGPLIVRNITRQIFFMMSYPIGAGVGRYRGGEVL